MLTVILTSLLCYNIYYKPIDIIPVYKPNEIKLKVAKNTKLSRKQKQLLFKWCKFYAKRSATKADIDNIIKAVYKNTNDPWLMLAITSVESNFDKDAVSSKGAVGLTQVMPLWLPELKKIYNINNINDLKKIGNNITAGNHVITYYTKKEGNLPAGLNEYVNGSSYYVKKVLERYIGIALYLTFGS